MDKKIALGFDLRLLECLAFSVFEVFLTSILFIRSKDAEFREKRQQQLCKPANHLHIPQHPSVQFSTTLEMLDNNHPVYD